MAIKFCEAISVIKTLKDENKEWKVGESYKDFRANGKKSSYIASIFSDDRLKGLQAESKPSFISRLFNRKVNRDIGAVGNVFAETFTAKADYSDVSLQDLNTAKFVLTALQERAAYRKKDTTGYGKALEKIDAEILVKTSQGSNDRSRDQSSNSSSSSRSSIVVVSPGSTVLPKPTTFADLVTEKPQTKRDFFVELSKMAQKSPYKKQKSLYNAAYEGLRTSGWETLLGGSDSTSIDKATQEAIVNYFQSYFDYLEKPSPAKVSRTNSSGSTDSGFSTGSNESSGSYADRMAAASAGGTNTPAYMMGTVLRQAMTTTTKVDGKPKISAEELARLKKEFLKELGASLAKKIKDSRIVSTEWNYDSSRTAWYQDYTVAITFAYDFQEPRTFKVNVPQDKLEAYAKLGTDAERKAFISSTSDATFKELHEKQEKMLNKKK